jgi:DNA-binding CsgD family transcriptional regulator
MEAYALGGPWPLAVGGSAGRPLTARELTVAGLVADGLSNAQIADRLGLSARTVASHLEHIRTKLNLTSRTQVAVWATENAQRGGVEHRTR